MKLVITAHHIKISKTCKSWFQLW